MFDLMGYQARGDYVTDDTAAINAAINAARAAGGGTVWAPPGRYRHTGMILPPNGNVALEGDGAATTQFINVHETNPSITMAGPGAATTCRNVRIRNLTLNASAANPGQSAISMGWAVKWKIDTVLVNGHGVGVTMATSWAGSFNDLHISGCLTGFSCKILPGAGASSPAVINNMTVYNCGTGMWSENGLTSLNWSGGTLGNCGTGLRMDGPVNSAVNFVGVNWENNGQDMQLGTPQTPTSQIPGPKSIKFDNCEFLSHSDKALSTNLLRAANLTFDTCYWYNDRPPSKIALGISQSKDVGTLTLINPRFEGVTTHVQTPSGAYQIPAGTALWVSTGYGGPTGVGGVARVGAI